MKQSLVNWFPLRTKYLQSEAWLANTLLPDSMQFYLNSLQQQAIPPDQNVKLLPTRNYVGYKMNSYVYVCKKEGDNDNDNSYSYEEEAKHHDDKSCISLPAGGSISGQ